MITQRCFVCARITFLGIGASCFDSPLYSGIALYWNKRKSLANGMSLLRFTLLEAFVNICLVGLSKSLKKVENNTKLEISFHHFFIRIQLMLRIPNF